MCTTHRMSEPPINGKMSKFNAALGLLQLEHIEAALQRRAEVAARYRAELRSPHATGPH